MIKLSRDTNGNKTAKYTDGANRAFSVQTLGNMPLTHTMDNYTLNQATATNELHAYVKHFGTNRQKEILGW